MPNITELPPPTCGVLISHGTARALADGLAVFEHPGPLSTFARLGRITSGLVAIVRDRMASADRDTTEVTRSQFRCLIHYIEVHGGEQGQRDPVPGWSKL